jgi:hypothetical protein
VSETFPTVSTIECNLAVSAVVNRKNLDAVVAAVGGWCGLDSCDNAIYQNSGKKRLLNDCTYVELCNP